MTKWNKEWDSYIPDGMINDAISKWHANKPDREQDCATPSTLLDCPRVVWLKYKKKVPPKINMGWGKQQRNMLGRQLEQLIAEQLRESGNLIYHWRDGHNDESVKFEMSEGFSRICGTPDLLLKLPDGRVAISDAKTSMGKSFGYISTEADEAFEDYFWYRYKLQVETYYMLSHKNKDWFKDLPLPEVCHLFSYALDDGINRREFIWKSTQDTASQIIYYANRWNQAYASETMPECTCEKFEGAPKKFCYYVTEQETTRTGAKIGVKCCDEDLYDTK